MHSWQYNIIFGVCNILQEIKSNINSNSNIGNVIILHYFLVIELILSYPYVCIG